VTTHLSSLYQPFVSSPSRGGRSVPCRHRVRGLEPEAWPLGHPADSPGEVFRAAGIDTEVATDMPGGARGSWRSTPA
jgi:hypothetical protein